MSKGAPFTFSVVTPSFNQGEFLEETIKSVLSQRGDFCIDYIIMDGGSTDDSVEIIKKYDGLLKRGEWPVKCAGIQYRWVSEKDDGQADAIEKGFKIATGDIGVWLNSDDFFYDEEVFAAVERYFRTEDVDLVIGNGITTDREGRKTGDYSTEKICFRELVFLDYHILQPSAFMKVEHYKNTPFDKGLNYVFDADFFIRLLNSGIRYRKVPEKLSCFRVYPEIKTISGMGERAREFMVVARKITDNKRLLFLTRVYKYLSVVVNVKYGESKAVHWPFLVLRGVFYLLILGTWGRR